MTALDFLLSAAAIAPVWIERRPADRRHDPRLHPGNAQATATNTNLGIVLLLAPWRVFSRISTSAAG